ncbi:efflux RND transporter permease subunit, partial [Enterobacter intestinihominis]
FALLAALAISINTITMFGMLLSIGLLFDDSIEVEHNVERVIVEDKLPQKQSTQKSKEQIQCALLGNCIL